ncbi:MAG: hypothetical protein DWQ31_04025 [Planctomycetota bacterium]|nr:MAG: hypothetical protein DWQ31_04025 [Planctomycetota bacterium]REJ94135.1 MAG: hypothetical protein DWQ35_08940 [Planctomycetota bacterium]
MNESPASDSHGWFYTPYQEIPGWQRRSRGWVLIVSASIILLAGAAGAIAAPFAKSWSAALTITLLLAPVAAMALGAVIDGRAMLKNQRISLLGRLAVFLATCAAFGVWTVLARLF